MAPKKKDKKATAKVESEPNEAPADAPAGDVEAAAEKDEKDKKSKKGKKEPPPKKESAIVKAARERREAALKLEEEKRAFEEEQKRIAEEEERKRKEEEDRIEAEKQAKRDARLAKIAKQKEEGTYKTKKEKERAKRAEELRKMFGFNVEDNKEDEEGEGNEDKPEKFEGNEDKPEKSEKPAPTGKISKKSMMPKKKKQPVKKFGDDEENEEAAVEEKAKEEVKVDEIKLEEKVEEKKEEEEGPDWEEIAEKEELEPEEEKGKEVAKTDGKENSDDEDSDSDNSDSSSSSSDSSDFVGYRSPIIVIMGHVDTGKTKLLDKIRRTNVQEGEAGGITQQIGATFFPDIALNEQTKKVDPEFDIEVPGMMVIDTPGHESFNNLRMRGSSLCDMAIVVIDVMHGLEPQTVESLDMLKKRRCPFIIALNKIDVCYQWSSKTYTPIRESLDRQEQFVRDEFQQRFDNVKLQLNERGLNVALYWENEDPRSTVSIVPTSALTGEGVPDLLYQLILRAQTNLASKIEIKEELECTVIEVKNIEGLGTTIDVVLVNGSLNEGDQIVIAGLGAPIVTTIRALLTPQPMKEMRVKNEYMHHTKISTSMGVKICAPGLDDAVAGSPLLIVGPNDDVEELKDDVTEGFDSVLNEFEKQPEGVYVKSSTLGSLEALINFLQEMKIPVFDVGIGEVHKKDVKRASIMREKKRPEFALILCFDVKVNSEAINQAKTDDVQIMTADIIYHLFDKFKAHMEKHMESLKTENKKVAVFPVVLQIDKQYIFHRGDPFIFGCNVVGGQLRIGTPICVPDKENLVIGHVGSIQKDKKDVQIARRGDTVCVKIEQNTAQKHIGFGRHFDHTNNLVSHITRESIDTLKGHFKDEMQKSDWELVISLKKLFDIQ